MLDTIVAKATQLSSTEAGAIYVFDEADQQFQLRATYGMTAEMIAVIKEHHADFSDAVSAATQRREPDQVADLRPSSRANEMIMRLGYRARLVVPLLAADRIVGALVVRRKAPGEFSQSTVELLQTFAAQSVLAIQNARLFAEIEDKSRQLQMASENKSQFVSSMSHELRTPLNAIIGLTEMMVTNAARFGTEKAQEPLQRVNRAGTHLLGLINQVLDLSKIEAGKLELNPQTVQLAPLIEEVIGTARQLAEQNKNRLDCRRAGEPRRSDGRPHAAAANPAQSIEQCLQVHKGGRGQAAGAQGGRRPRLDRAFRLRYRHRHDAGAAGEAVRGVHPGRCHDRAAFRRHRARPRHHPQARPHDGRRRDSDERAGQRLGVYSAPAGGLNAMTLAVDFCIWPRVLPRSRRSHLSLKI